MFGQIAASNSLSDVYAMGGEPIIALNIVCFPNCLEPSVLNEILRGGADKVKEAGALLVGGHSVEDDEPKYGLSVTGTVHPDKVLSNASAKEGDVLVITKPIGLGIINTCMKEDMVGPEIVKKATFIMAYLNKTAADYMMKVDVNSCTDVTGFGLLGHAKEMAEGSDVTIVIDSTKVPVIEGAEENAKMGLVPAGAYRNRDYVGPGVDMAESIETHTEDILYDPQTSGGLLISLRREEAEKLCAYYEEHLETEFAIIGEVIQKGEKSIIVK